MNEFSYRTRAEALKRFRTETFDLLIIGGGITGATTARDAASRGLKVALVEKTDFAWGTSSRSSKLIHGGLRYLENLEFKLVFEALSERAFLLKSAPHRVRPLPFFFPVYQRDPHGMGTLSLGMWLYDLLAVFRTPGFHRRYSKKALLREIPFLKAEALVGGFRYFDASMWDDGLAIETLRSAHQLGAQVANYCEAVEPLWRGDQIVGFRVNDRATQETPMELLAHRVVLCAGPWTDEFGERLIPGWKPWLAASKGVHLVFDLKRIPVPGAMVMSHPQDGRISFVMPRADLGAGVTIVGTTDCPSPKNPEASRVDSSDVQYLLDLLTQYFPTLNLSQSDILSTYVGVRPLFRAGAGGTALQKVSREHHIGLGPGGITVVVGGKYTTSRNMAQEIVDFTLREWRNAARQDGKTYYPNGIGPSRTQYPVNPDALPHRVEAARSIAMRTMNEEIPNRLFAQYGAEALMIAQLHEEFKHPTKQPDPEGFDWLDAQLRFAVRNSMVMKLEDFYHRRVALYLTRKDHGSLWYEALKKTLEDEMRL